MSENTEKSTNEKVLRSVPRHTQVMTGENQLDLQFGEVLKHLGMSQLLMEDIIYPRASVEDHKFPEEWYENNKQFLFYFAYPCDDSFSKGNNRLCDGTHGLAPNHDITFFGSKVGLYKGKFNILDVPFEDGDVALDIGSNLGVCSIVLAGINPNIRVIAFDANPLVCKIFKLNALINTVYNADIYNVAVGKDTIESLDFYTDAEFNTCALPSESKNEEHTQKVGSVRQIKLKDILNSELLNIDKVKYAKIDIEGAEIPMFEDILENDKELLNKIEYLNIEIHNCDTMGENYEERGFSLFNKLREFYKNNVWFQSSKPLM